MLKNYFKIAIRNMMRNKVYSLINILGLSIGVACCLLLALYIQDIYAGLAALLIALITVSLAASTNPVKALRTE